MLRFEWKCGICLFALVCFVGCGGGGGERPDTAPAAGTVNLNGSPLAGAIVTFSPTAAGGNAASGVTDAQGKFTLTTFETGDGAVPGSYKVGVRKAEAAKSAATGVSDDDAAYRAAAAEKAAAESGKQAPKASVPAWVKTYGSPATSGLTADVPEGGKEDFVFDLKE
jgi:hypothetical protein